MIGYMGSGKTTIGKKLARKLNFQFIDMDWFIENRYRKSVNQLFAEKGEEAFREIEHKVLEEVSSFEHTVISTGGGAPCFSGNMELMNQNGCTIFLKVSVDDLVNRLNVGKDSRPLLKDKTPEEMRIFVSESLDKRNPFYNQAQLVFDTGKMLVKTDIGQIVDDMVLMLSNTHKIQIPNENV